MKYIDFYQQFQNYPLISLVDIKNWQTDFDQRRLYEWQKRGHIIKVSNKFYVFKDKMLSEFEMGFIANQLYQPSYLSLEYALRFYNLIPEMVFMHNSITTKKTRFIKSTIGSFSYQAVKKDLFFGYKLVTHQGVSFKIAEPEKAILDFFYLRSDIKTAEDIYELRINQENFAEIIDCNKLEDYKQKFNSKILDKKIKLLKKYVEFERN